MNMGGNLPDGASATLIYLPPVRQFVLDYICCQTASRNVYAGMPPGQERTKGLLSGGFEIVEDHSARHVNFDLPRTAFKLE